jgi:hypothetical protein
MIAELSDGAQFITTSAHQLSRRLLAQPPSSSSADPSPHFDYPAFRPELIATCDKAYGVVFSNEKVSTLKTITKDQAMQFVDHTLTEGT